MLRPLVDNMTTGLVGFMDNGDPGEIRLDVQVSTIGTITRVYRASLSRGLGGMHRGNYSITFPTVEIFTEHYPGSQILNTAGEGNDLPGAYLSWSMSISPSPALSSLLLRPHPTDFIPRGPWIHHRIAKQPQPLAPIVPRLPGTTSGPAHHSQRHSATISTPSQTTASLRPRHTSTWSAVDKQVVECIELSSDDEEIPDALLAPPPVGKHVERRAKPVDDAVRKIRKLSVSSTPGPSPFSLLTFAELI